MSDKSNLDLMRTYAVFLVVLDHLSLAQQMPVIAHQSMAWMGTAGVYIFFVHTSLVLMWSLERRPQPLEFFIRRIFRIYPLAMLVVILAVAFHAPVGGTLAKYFAYRSPDGIHGFLYNLLLLQYAFDYPSVVSVLWSLPLELGMYMFLPAFFFLFRKNSNIWAIFLLWAASVFVAGGLTTVANIFPTVIPCFLPGIMAYVLYRRIGPSVPAWLFPLFLLLITAIFLIEPTVGHSWYFCLVLGVCLPFFRQIAWIPLRSMTHQVAKYSYGIYLCHPFAIVIGFYLLSGHPLWVKLTGTVASLTLLSISAYWLVEKPMIDLGSRVAARAKEHLEVHATC